MNRAPLWLGLACVVTCAFAACTRSEPSEPEPPDEGEAGSGPNKVGPTTNAGRSGLQQDAGGGRDGGSAGSAGNGAGGSDASTGAAGRDASTGTDASTDASVDAGTDGAPPALCEPDEYRCTAAGRERCTAAGDEWESAPCPLDTPACDDGECVLRGPTMARVGTFYVDSTEVTVGQYVAFLDARREDTEGQPTVCSWNTSFYEGTPLGPENWPITEVDWCDARAFCAWAGKRLCGAIEGGAVEVADLMKADQGQWILACGGTGMASHPANNSDCNNGSSGLEPVGTPTCEGFYPGLFDLEGNAAEWVDSCDTETGATDECYLLGGSYVPNIGYCTHVPINYPRNGKAGPFGFRCCSG